MTRSILVVLIALLGCGVTRAAAQEAHPAAKDDPSKPTHGIVRRAPPRTEPAKPTAEAPKPANEATPTAEPSKPANATGKAAEAVKLAPQASTQAVAAAIAAAVRSIEEKKKPEPVRPRAVARTEAPRVPQRRYAVTWPSQRLQVQWDTPEDRITLSWSASDRLAGRDDRELLP